MPETFGGRLRERREQREVPLSAIAEETKISLSLLEGLERDDVSRWPGGIFRRAFIRAYAVAIGLDPDRIVREFVQLHPDPVETTTVICETLNHPEPAEPPPSGFWRALAGSLRAVTRSRSVVEPPRKNQSSIDAPGTAVVPTRATAAAVVPAVTRNPAVVPAVTRDPAVVPAIARDPAVAPTVAREPAVVPAVARDPDVVAAVAAPVVVAPAPPMLAHEVNWVEAAGVCTKLSQVQGADDATPLLAKVGHLLGAGGIILWTWEPQIGALRPALSHGYSPKIVAQLPMVRREDDNATAAAFQSGRTCIVSGSDRISGGMAVPLLGPAGCLGVLALELREGGEHSESVQAFATIMAAQLAGLVDATAGVDVSALRRA